MNNKIKNRAQEVYPVTEKAECYTAFLQGASVAQQELIDKACNWLKENIDIYTKVVINHKSHYPEIVMCDTFEKNFKKAMEE